MPGSAAKKDTNTRIRDVRTSSRRDMSFTSDLLESYEVLLDLHIFDAPICQVHNVCSMLVVCEDRRICMRNTSRCCPTL